LSLIKINLSYWFYLVLALNSLLCADDAVKNLLTRSLTHAYVTYYLPKKLPNVSF